MSDGLKPCPWCGEEHICLFDEHDDEGLSFAVGCVSEDCPGHVATSWRYITREKAIEAWNTRAERTCTVENIYSTGYQETDWGECSSCCGVFPYQGDVVACPKCGAKVVD